MCTIYETHSVQKLNVTVFRSTIISMRAADVIAENYINEYVKNVLFKSFPVVSQNAKSIIQILNGKKSLGNILGNVPKVY